MTRKNKAPLTHVSHDTRDTKTLTVKTLKRICPTEFNVWAFNS